MGVIEVHANLPDTTHGTCEMCGKLGQELWMLFIGDYAGWTCSECISQVQKSQERRFVAVGESTEPAE